MSVRCFQCGALLQAVTAFAHARTHEIVFEHKTFIFVAPWLHCNHAALLIHDHAWRRRR